MLKKIFKILVIFIFGMAGGIFADQIFWPYFVERPLFYQYRLEQSPIYLTEKKEIIIQENLALRNAVEKVEKVVMGVRTRTKKGQILTGSGLILTSDGLAVTLADLLPLGQDFSFYVNDKATAYQILKRDSQNNLALVKLEEDNLPTAGFADFEKIRLGERVFLVGVVFQSDPEGKQIILEKIINEGIIKNFNDDLIETNILEGAEISGSPLFNIEGQVVGLVKVDKSGKVSAIPIPKIRQFTGL